MNTKDNQRGINSVVKIEQAFLELLTTDLRNKITVKAICEIAQVNRTTFYAHFTDINDLVTHIQEKKQQEVVVMIDEILLPDLSNFVDAITKLFDFVANNRVFYAVYLNYHSGISLVDSQKLQTFSKLKMPQLSQSKQAREYRMNFFIAGLGAVIRQWIKNDCQESPVVMAQLIEAEYQTQSKS